MHHSHLYVQTSTRLQEIRRSGLVPLPMTRLPVLLPTKATHLLCFLPGSLFHLVPQKACILCFSLHHPHTCTLCRRKHLPQRLQLQRLRRKLRILMRLPTRGIILRLLQWYLSIWATRPLPTIQVLCSRCPLEWRLNGTRTGTEMEETIWSRQQEKRMV